MKNKKIEYTSCLRIGRDNYTPKDRFDSLLELLGRYGGFTKELTLFTSETHPPIELELMAKRVEVMKETILKAKEHGYSCGINILSTIGHHNENLEHSLQGDYVRMTNIKGEICLGSFCPNDEKLKVFVKETYKLLISANPDHIWIDDDIRFGHMPIGDGCYCDNCLKIFEKEYGVLYTREELNIKFNSGNLEEKMDIRKKWLQHNRNTISNLFVLIEETVHNIKPDLPLGFMTGDRFFEGYDFFNWAKILEGKNKSEVMWRPGGGAYKDDRLADFFDKANSLGRQSSVLPDSVIKIQSETENFPYQFINKSPKSTVLEASLYLGAGCTGNTFNILPGYTEPFETFEPLISGLSEVKPFFKNMVKTNGKVAPKGIYTGWNINSFAVGNGEENWASTNPIKYVCDFTRDLYEIGLPVAYSLDAATTTVLTGESISMMSNEDILKVLSKGVYMDPEALDTLNMMGYGEYLGFETKEYLKADCIEYYVNHEINKGIEGGQRNARQAFFAGTVASLKASSSSSETLASVVNYQEELVADCCAGIFENSLGGRICVAAYAPWTILHDSFKTIQLNRIFKWLSKETMPSYIDSLYRIYNWTRVLEDGRVAISLCNASLDKIKNTRIKIKTKSKKCDVYDMQNEKLNAILVESDDEYNTFEIDEIEPWSMCLLITKN